MRTGEYKQQPAGHNAFIPKPLPPSPPIQYDEELIGLLANAQGALSRLDGMARIIPNPDLFVAMYVRKEALISSQIEGTQSSLIDVLEYEVRTPKQPPIHDVGEVINYVGAMNYGLERLLEIPLCNRLIREIHERLVADVRGAEWTPGQFRRTQNWIGPRPDSPISEAIFIPPSPEEAQIAMGDLERFLQGDSEIPTLIRCGLVHSQFETIHPFIDGNGRLGRLLITFILCHEGNLRRPLLYLSAHFKKYKTEYYNKLQNVRDKGDWEGWLKFFLQGIWQVAEEAIETAEKIISMQETHRELIQQKMSGPASGLRMLEILYQLPVVNVNEISNRLGVVYRTANRLVAEFEKHGLLFERTGRRRNRRFYYEPYLALLMKDT